MKLLLITAATSLLSAMVLADIPCALTPLSRDFHHATQDAKDDQVFSENDVSVIMPGLIYKTVPEVMTENGPSHFDNEHESDTRNGHGSDNSFRSPLPTRDHMITDDTHNVNSFRSPLKSREHMYTDDAHNVNSFRSPLPSRDHMITDDTHDVNSFQSPLPSRDHMITDDTQDVNSFRSPLPSRDNVITDDLKATNSGFARDIHLYEQFESHLQDTRDEYKKPPHKDVLIRDGNHKAATLPLLTIGDGRYRRASQVEPDVEGDELTNNKATEAKLDYHAAKDLGGNFVSFRRIIYNCPPLQLPERRFLDGRQFQIRTAPAMR